MQRYYIQYLSGYDAVALGQMIQNLSICPEDESIILSSLCNTITNLSVKQGTFYLIYLQTILSLNIYIYI